MQKHPKITEARIQHALDKIRALIHPDAISVSVEAWNVGGEPVPYEVAVNAEYQPVSIGYAWGPSWDTTWFRIRGEIPASWAGREAVVLFKINGTKSDWFSSTEGFTAEGLIYKNGQPVRAINVHRSQIEVSKCAAGGEKFEYYVEAAANSSDPWGSNTKTEKKPLFVLQQADLTFIDRRAFDYHCDFKFVADAMAVLTEGQRRAELLYALNESLNRLDFENPDTIPAAREALGEVLAKKNGDTAHQLSAIGHSHIDSAWLWPLRETIRKCARTFSTALDYMERYPEYVFGCSQAQQYAWMKSYYPAIYARMKEAFKRGQWEPIGSMWVEADCNLASGESLIRQILIGKRFYRDEFGYETRDLWLPDVFGYSAALPQILKGCGVDYFITQKISWSEFNKFPHHTFLWEGIDGTRVFTHFPPADTYNAQFTPRELLFNVSNFKEHGRATRSLYVYGFGDGGGGPTVEMLETARRVADFDGLPKVKLEKVTSFLEKAENDAKDPAVWIGELYLEYHRGTYTTQAKNKRGNRKSELLLRDAEFWDAIGFAHVSNRALAAAAPDHSVYDVSTDDGTHTAALDRAWKLLLLNQFHDIIPGSSIGWVYEDSARDYATISEIGKSVRDGSMRALASQINTAMFAKPVCISNTLSWDRKEIVDFQDGTVQKVTVPAAGYIVVDADAKPTLPEPGVVLSEKDGIIEINNGLLKIKIGANGLLQSIWDIKAEREVLAPGAEGNLFQLHPDEAPQFDAWDVAVFYKETVQDLREISRMEVVERHPLRMKVRIERPFGKSRIEQEIIVRADSRRIDFDTRVHWHENHKLLKVAFPVDIRSARATYEIQFGHVERPTHYNTSWDLARFEVCAHKWADLGEPNYGVALLNDCKYGYDIFGNTIRLSLLRSPKNPDPNADMGDHHFTYSLFPHEGDFRAAGVIQESYNLNVPLELHSLEQSAGPLNSTHSFFSIDNPGIIAESIKVGEDGKSVVVRLYESHGARGKARLRIGLPVKEVRRVNLLEEETGGVEALDKGEVTLQFRPFELTTIKLILQ